MFPPRNPDIHNIVLRSLGRMWYTCDMSTDIQAQELVSIISLTRSQPALALTLDCVSVAILLDVREAALQLTMQHRRIHTDKQGKCRCRRTLFVSFEDEDDSDSQSVNSNPTHLMLTNGVLGMEVYELCTVPPEPNQESANNAPNHTDRRMQVSEDAGNFEHT